MLINFLKVYFRFFSRNKIFSTLNLSGLVVALTTCLLLFSYLLHEWSFDRFHARPDDIYRLEVFSDSPQTRTPHPMSQAMVRDFPEIEAAVTLTPLYGPGLTLQSIYIGNPENNVLYKEADGFAADSTFFDVFDFELIHGNKMTALKEAGSVIISETMAKKYFGDDNPLGKLLEGGQSLHAFVVNGVMKDIPANSHFHPSFIIPYMTLKQDPGNEEWMSWKDFGHFNYVKLKDGATTDHIEAKMASWLQQYIVLTDNQKEGLDLGIWGVRLNPVPDIHLNSHIRWELESNGNKSTVFILLAAIVFVLLIAIINFVNLSTAKAFERSKEVSIRKAMGAGRKSIGFQFMAEAIFTTLLALVISYSLAILMIPYFNQLAGARFSFADLFKAQIIGCSILVVLLIGLFAGLYPSLGVSKILATDVVRGKFSKSGENNRIRKGLLIIQYAVTIILIFGSLIIIEQVRFLSNKQLGFNEDQVLVLDLHENEREKLEIYKEEIRKINGVIDVGALSNLPGDQFNNHSFFPAGDRNAAIDVADAWVDFDALHVLGITLKEGRFFEPSRRLDSTGRTFIVNEAAIGQLDLKYHYKNQKFTWDAYGENANGNIVGVLNDFHFKSLHKDIRPIVIGVSTLGLNRLVIKVQGDNIPHVLKRLERLHTEFDPVFHFDHFFLSDSLNDLYHKEKNILRIFNIFTFIALILTTIGLLGLAYLMTTQRTKEIGIRKVMGATILQLLWKENRTFIQLALVSLVIGLPTAYRVMQSWLSDFAYRISIDWEPFFISGISIIVLTVVSVTIAVLRTTLANPSDALKYE